MTAPDALGAALIALVIGFVLGEMFGWHRGTADTERRWSDAVRRKEHNDHARAYLWPLCGCDGIADRARAASGQSATNLHRHPRPVDNPNTSARITIPIRHLVWRPHPRRDEVSR